MAPMASVTASVIARSSAALRNCSCSGAMSMAGPNSTVILPGRGMVTSGGCNFAVPIKAHGMIGAPVLKGKPRDPVRRGGVDRRATASPLGVDAEGPTFGQHPLGDVQRLAAARVVRASTGMVPKERNHERTKAP